ncbi:MAG: hypothetical protein SH817_08720 [Leptospira sp.]|nr:hypothetical protein [Leptospira sp.]
MKKLIFILVTFSIILNCASSNNGEKKADTENETKIRNTEVWADLKDLNTEKKYTTSGYSINRKSKIQNFLLMSNLNINLEQVEITFLETNSFYTVPVAAFSINNKSRYELINCLGKFIEWDKIAILNNDKVEKEICSIDYSSDPERSPLLQVNGKFKITLFTDSPKKNAARFDFGEIRDPNDDSKLRRFDFHYLNKNEIIGLMNSLTDKEISKQVFAYIKKERATQRRYK